MSDLEQHFIQASKQLHDAAHQCAHLKLQLISRYMEQHHPGVKFEVSTGEDDTLSTDLVFPGAGRARSYELSYEIRDYLEALLGHATVVIK